MKLHIHHLHITWAISRGRDTAGYNICRLDDSISRKRFRCMGGGYDMIGTVFGEFIQSEYQAELQALVSAKSAELVDCGYTVPGYKKIPSLYGLTLNPDGSVSLDGACGISCMRTIAETIGLSVQWEGNRKGHTVGYFVSREIN